MIHSKFIPSILAAFCGLVLQFQASSANATPEFGTAGNTYNMNVTTGYTMYVGSPQICSPVVGNCLVMEANGNLVLYSYEGVSLWSSNTDVNPGNTNPDFDNFMQFLPNGDMRIATSCDCPSGYNVYFDTGTNQGGYEDWSGYQGQYLAVQDDGNLVIYDGYLNVLWAATYDSTYNWAEASNVKQVCYQWGACW